MECLLFMFKSNSLQNTFEIKFKIIIPTTLLEVKKYTINRGTLPVRIEGLNLPYSRDCFFILIVF